MDTAEKLLALGFIAFIMLFLYLIIALFLGRRKQEEGTPVTKEGLKQYDGLPSGVAVLMSWTEPGANPEWHRKMQDEVRVKMPLLARALDRYTIN